jgi:Zn-dependent protease
MTGLRIPRPVFVARLFGIPLMLDWSWMPVIPLYTWAIAVIYLPQHVDDISAPAAWGLGLVTTLLLIVSIVTHELAHALVARTEGVQIQDITLYLFGGMARMTGEPPTAMAELKIAAVGPGASFALGVLFLALDTALFSGTHFVGAGRVFYHLGIVNLVLAMFNLLPGFPLDGGRVLRAVLWMKRKDPVSATRTARTWGRAIGWSLLGVGLYYLVLDDWLTGLWAVIIGAVLLTLLGRTEGSVPKAAARDAGTVADVMRSPAVAISPQTTVQELVDVTLPAHRQTSFVVMQDGRMHGMLSLASVRDLPPERWPHTPVASEMRPVDDSLFVTATASIADARRLLQRNGVGHVAVLDGEGIVVGSLDLADLR